MLQLFESPIEKAKRNWMWCCIPVIPALRRQRQEDYEFEANFGSVARPFLINQPTNETTTRGNSKGAGQKFKCAMTSVVKTLTALPYLSFTHISCAVNFLVLHLCRP
jgi:hypothetical protein